VAVSGAAGMRALSVLIAGPTAGGKSRLALELARGRGGVVINADAMQVYRELRILTARPDAAAQALAPHRLYGFVSARDAYSAGLWRERARAEIARAHAAGRVAIVVGGTGLYFESLGKGLATIPEVAPEVRAKWRKIAAVQGAEEVRRHLESADPVMAARIAPGDRQRAVRALEVLEATGRSLAWWQARGPSGGEAPQGTCLRLVVAPERALLHQRIDARAAAMIEAGALDEVRALLSLVPEGDLPASKAIGVRELAGVLAGTCELERALDAMRAATRRYAKRQLTWARRRMADWHWPGDARQARAVAEEFLSGA
jgi:tRNA dimethylallyltransferase